MRVAREEVFGPVMAVMKFSEERDAIELANSAGHSGLMCSVFTRDLGRMLRAANGVRAGHIVSNQPAIGGAEVPFGGFGALAFGAAVPGRQTEASAPETRASLCAGDLRGRSSR